MKAVTNATIALLNQALVIGLIGGLVGIGASMVFGSFFASPIGQLIISLVLLVGFIYVGLQSKIYANFFRFLTLLFGVGIVSSFFAAFFPAVTPYVLSLPEFTISGLLTTGLYIGIAELIRKKLNIL